MIRIPYDTRFDPPAPVLPLRLRLPRSGAWLQLVGFLDSGADITLIPADVAEQHLPFAGFVRVRGVTGDDEEALLFRVEMEIAGIKRVGLVAGLGTETVIGRDFLNRLVLHLDGPAEVVTLV